jgi:hypothetical protein
MKYYIVVIFTFFLFSCSSKDFDYKISISDSEYTIMKEYIKRHKNIKKSIFLEKNNISSDDKSTLIKIKMRLAGIVGPMYPRDCWSYYPYIPIIINYQNNFYEIYLSNNDYFHNNNAKKLNWLDEEYLYKKLFPEYVRLININVPEKLLNLTKDEFIEEYFLIDENKKYGKYKCKVEIERVLLENDKHMENELLYDSIIYLCIVKYNLLVTLYGGKIYFEEIL